VLVSARIAGGIRKAHGIQAVRDLLINAMREELVPLLSASAAPAWLRECSEAMDHWKKSARFVAFLRRWEAESPLACPEAMTILRAWARRDLHLWSYQTGARGGSLRARLDHYRVTARRWADRYETVILPARDLRREARWGADSDVRQIAAPSELAGVLADACGKHRIVTAEWKRNDVDDEDRREWLDGAIEAGIARRTENEEITSGSDGGAWARRKHAASERAAARKTAAKAAE
jgi:hypothetical protein